MSLKAGDVVYCQYPTGDLEHDKLYTIGKVIPATKNEQSTVTLKGSTAPYFAYRFQTREDALNTNKRVDTLIQDTEKRNKYADTLKAVEEDAAKARDVLNVFKPLSQPLGDYPVKDKGLEPGTIISNGIGTPIQYIPLKAAKNDTEKADLSLVPQIALIEMAKAFMVGEKKYGRYNYCKGHDSSQLVGAMLRHATAYFNGEDHDPVDKQHHLGSVMACCAMLLRQQELGTLKDNRYKNENS